MMAVEKVLRNPKDRTDAAAPKTTSRIEIQKVTAFGGVNLMSFSLLTNSLIPIGAIELARYQHYTTFSNR
jgi:hypothetical protein